MDSRILRFRSGSRTLIFRCSIQMSSFHIIPNGHTVSWTRPFHTAPGPLRISRSRKKAAAREPSRRNAAAYLIITTSGRQSSRPSRSFRSSSFLRWSGRTTSSASSQNRYVPRPWENEKFLAAAKSSRHGKSKTLAPRSLAAAFVPSVDPSQGSHPGTRPHCPGTAPAPPLHFLRSCKDSRRPQPRPAFTRFYCQYMSRAKTVECFSEKTYNKTMKTTPEPESSGPQGGT